MALGLVLAACTSHQPAVDPAPPTSQRLPTGLRLDPAGRSIPLGNMPLAALPSADGRWLVVSLSGWREQGIEVVDRASGAVVQRFEQPGAFLGLAWSADGRTLYASGGMTNAIYAYRWNSAAPAPASRADSIPLARGDTSTARYPAGIALSPDGRRLYVAENLSDSLAVIDLATRRVVQRLGAGAYPYAVAVAPDGHVYVSAWDAAEVTVYRATPTGRLASERPIDVGRHPSALLLNADGSRLYVASASTDRVSIVDTKARRVLRWLSDPPPDGVTEGSTPDALAFSADGTKLFVAEADANAVAVFDLATGALAGRIPTEWYPSVIVVAGRGDSLWVVNGKGRGAGPNRGGPQPNVPFAKFDAHEYDLGQLDGTITVLPDARGAALDTLSRRVARADNWDTTRAAHAHYPPFSHVVYIIKENRTYDQVLGDIRAADGDSTLVFFPRAISPNHHALAERFGLFDRFFVNAEVSQQGHQWSTAAYVTDYTEKTTPDLYRGKRPEPEALGSADDPANGYLWDIARQKGLSVREYGEFEETMPRDSGDHGAPVYRALKPELAPYVSPIYPPFDLSVPDQRRADAWLTELHQFEQTGHMPALEIMHLPNDHTAGARLGRPTPQAYFADNDLALGRIVEGLSRSRFWDSTVVFVLEDDAQDGPDHVDSHRSVMLAISAWNRGGVLHRFTNTTDVIATIEEILGLPAMSQFDHFGRPLRDIWSDHPDHRPYVALKPAQPFDQLNVATGPDARRSARADFSEPDRVDDEAFNHILWRTVKGPGVPYPTLHRVAVQELVRTQ